MTRHCVLFSFKKDCSEESVRSIQERFVSLRDEIAEIQFLEWGINNSPEGKNKGFTHCFLLTFADDGSRDRYVAHPSHAAFSAFARPFLEDALVIDYPV